MFPKSTVLLFTFMVISILVHGQVGPAAISNNKVLKIVVPKSQQGKMLLIDSLKAAKINQAQILTAFLPDYNSAGFENELKTNVIVLFQAGFTFRDILIAIHTQYKYLPYTNVTQIFYDLGPGIIRQLNGNQYWANDLMRYISTEYGVTSYSGDGIYHLYKAKVSCNTTFGYFKDEMTGIADPQVLGSYILRFQVAGYSIDEIYASVIKRQYSTAMLDEHWHKAYCHGLRRARIGAKQIADVLTGNGKSKLDITSYLQYAGYSASEILGAL